MAKSEDVVVVYHAPCLDGMASRYAAWKHFGNAATYMPGKYEEDLDIELFRDKQVFCVDFSHKAKVIANILTVCASYRVLDHHITGMEEIHKAIQLVIDDPDRCSKLSFNYDPNKSGAGITWNAWNKGELPKVLQHIQDRDLWKFDIENTKIVCCYMKSLNYDFKKWVKAIEKENYLDIISKGTSIRKQEVDDITDLVRGVEMGQLFGYDIPVLTNCPKEYVSEACNRLLTEMYRKGQRCTHKEGKAFWPFTANRSWNGTGWLYSLRSTDEGVDVGALAKSQGGGGHRNASGFFMEQLMP